MSKLIQTILVSCCLLTMLGFSERLFANDGAYFMSGNHLIPIHETQIAIKKEILSVTRINKSQIEVDVYYEFSNPGKPKTLLVGFEVQQPSGDVQVRPIKGGHPYMYDFNVVMNHKKIAHRVSLVNSLKGFAQNQIDTITKKEWTALASDDNMHGLLYVYYFKANFKTGKNIIQHRYKFELSSSVDRHYSFDYILSAAGRWANHQIDDFTLNIDFGAFADFNLRQNFYISGKEWIISGEGRYEFEKISDDYEDGAKNTDHFFIRNGSISFKQLNFKPTNELQIFSKRLYGVDESFNQKIHRLPFGYLPHYESADDEFSKKILRNQPFAIRGYVFKDAAVQAYYESMPWYLPDTFYLGKLESLPVEERQWYEAHK